MKQKYFADSLKIAYTKKTFPNRIKPVSIITDECPEDIKMLLLTIQDALGCSFDLSYEIVHDAADFINNDGNAEAESHEFASLYTADRLDYIDNSNQQEISDIFKEMGCDDIATAAAIWYDQKAIEAFNALKSAYDE